MAAVTGVCSRLLDERCAPLRHLAVHVALLFLVLAHRLIAARFGMVIRAARSNEATGSCTCA